jgi:hypothetical protein
MIGRTLVLGALCMLATVPTANAQSVSIQHGVVSALPGRPSHYDPVVLFDITGPGAPVTEVHLEISAKHPSELRWVGAATYSLGPRPRPLNSSLEVRVVPPAGTPYGAYRFDVRVVAGGVSIGTTHFVVVVGDVLDTPTFRTHWQGRAFSGGLEVGGFAPTAGTLTVEVSSAGPVPAITRTFQLYGGAYKKFVRLGHDALPGAYSVKETVAPTQAYATGLSDFIQRFVAHLSGPPQGYVDQAFVSAVEFGPAMETLAPGAKALYVTFHLAAAPTGGDLTTTWYQPGGEKTPSVPKHANGFVRGFVRSTAPLASGLWRCVLRANGVEIGEASVRIG